MQESDLLKFSCAVLFTLSICSCSTPLFITKNNIDLYAIKENGKIGYINQKGKVVIKPVYGDCCIDLINSKCCSENFLGDEYAIISENGLLGAINYKGELVIKCEYNELEQSNDSTFIAKKKDKWGVISNQSKIVFPFVFDSEAFLSSNDIAIGRIDSIYYLLNYRDRTMIKTVYQSISPFFGGLAEFELDNKHGFINKEGTIIIKPRFDDAWGFNEGLAPVKVGYKWGFIDTTGRMVIEPQFDMTYGFEIAYNEGYAFVTIAGKMGMIDKAGKFIIPAKYDNLNSEADDLIFACIVNNGYTSMCGIMNQKQEWLVMPAEYANPKYFGGYITERKNGGYGVYKLKTGKVIVPYVFSSVEFYNTGLSKVEYYDGKKGRSFFGYINRRGKAVWVEDGFELKKILKESKIIEH